MSIRSCERRVAKEPERRYLSAADLATDIEHYLEGKPISARPPSTWYQLALFSRRNRALVTAVAAIFSVLIVALAITGSALQRSMIAQRAADAERIQSETIVEILTGSLGAANPNLAGDANYTVSQWIDDLAAEVANREELRSDTEAQVRQVLADTYVGLGRYQEAIGELERGAALRLQSNGPDDVMTLDIQEDLGAALLDSGAYARAHEVLEEVTTRSERVLGPFHGDTLSTHILPGLRRVPIGRYRRGGTGLFGDREETH